MSSTTRLQPRDISSLDSTKLFDEGCIKTRREEVIRHRMVELELEEKKKLREAEYKKALKEKKPPKPFQWRELSQGERHDRYFEEASKFADQIIEQERHVFAESKEAWLLKLLKRARNSLKMFMLVADEEGNIVKPTFVSRVIDSQWGIHHESYADVFGEKDRDRLTIVSRLKQQVANVQYLIPYSSDEVKALRDEIIKLATPDHYEVWRNDKIVQVYGGRYEFTDRKLEGKAWVKRVKERAEKLMIEKAKKASE